MSNPNTEYENPTYDCSHRSDFLSYEHPAKLLGFAELVFTKSRFL